MQETTRCFFYYRPQRSWGKVIFSEACVNDSVWGSVRGFIRGACVVLFGGACMVLFGGRAWFYLGGMRGFIWGGMCGFIRGACMVLFGGVWFYSGGVWFYLGGQRAWLLWGGGMRGCSGGSMHGFFDEILPMSGRYASYWNAFLLGIKFSILD